MAMERGGVTGGFFFRWMCGRPPTNSLLSATEVCRSNEKILSVKWKPGEKTKLRFERNSNKRLSHKLACVSASL